MEKVIVCQCKTSKDCINYVQTGKENDFSCRHYVNPKDIEGVTTHVDCVNYVTEEGLSDYKSVLEHVIELQKHNPIFMATCPCCDDEVDESEEYNSGWDDGYNAGYMQGVKDTLDNVYGDDEDDECTDDCDGDCDDCKFGIDDDEEEEETPDPLRRLCW